MMEMSINALGFLRLLQIADSALPIGATAHSFGLETLVAEELLDVAQLEAFLKDYLEEAGSFESYYCRRAYRLAVSESSACIESWLTLNAELSAYKTARESRVASATLGRRLLQLVQNLTTSPLLHEAIQAAKAESIEIHYSPAFGLLGALLTIAEEATVLAYLHQSSAGLISACQRLLPLGQNQASAILWRLKPTLLSSAQRSAQLLERNERPSNFTPLSELAGMRHPELTTRLFIS